MLLTILPWWRRSVLPLRRGAILTLSRSSVLAGWGSSVLAWWCAAVGLGAGAFLVLGVVRLVDGAEKELDELGVG